MSGDEEETCARKPLAFLDRPPVVLDNSVWGWGDDAALTEVAAKAPPLGGAARWQQRELALVVADAEEIPKKKVKGEPKSAVKSEPKAPLLLYFSRLMFKAIYYLLG